MRGSESVLSDLPLSARQSKVGHKRIGINRALSLHVSADIRLNSMFFAVRNHHGANLTVTFQDAHDSGLVLHSAFGNHALPPLRVHEASRAADKSLIDFDVLSFAAEFFHAAELESQAETVKHEPCGLLCDAEVAPALIRANAVLEVNEKPQRGEPLVE